MHYYMTQFPLNCFIYSDTDSFYYLTSGDQYATKVIVDTLTGEVKTTIVKTHEAWKDLPHSDVLGELKLEETGIQRVAGLAPKNYGYTNVKSDGTSSEKAHTCVKAKGLRVDGINESILSFDNIWKLADDYSKPVDERTQIKVPCWNLQYNKDHMLPTETDADYAKKWRYALDPLKGTPIGHHEGRVEVVAFGYSPDV